MNTMFSSRYYLFSLSNLIAAFGGGTILGKCVGVIKGGMFQGGSVFAFFIGTVVGLAFLQLIPKKLAQSAGRWFSICGGIVSLILFGLFSCFSSDGSLSGVYGSLFFVILSIRFGFWFYSRVLRASEAAGYQRHIAWVELGYYAGIILGLIIWQFINIPISISSILLIDAAVQLLAGLLDYLCTTKKYLQEASDKVEQKIVASNQSEKISWCWRLAVSIMLLTVGVQVVVFSLAHAATPDVSAYMLAIFYLGVAVAASLYKKLDISLQWKSRQKNIGYAVILFGQYKVSFFIVSLFAAMLIFSSIMFSSYYQFMFKNIMYAAIFFAAFFYEILALAILDRIGLEEKSNNQSGMIIRAYGLMGIGAAVSFWMLDWVSGSSANLLILMSTCFLFSVMVLLRRRDFLGIC